MEPFASLSFLYSYCELENLFRLFGLNNQMNNCSPNAVCISRNIHS